VGPGTTAYTDTSVEPGQYFYAVTYFTDARESFQSNTAQVTIGGVVNVWTGSEWKQKPVMYFDGDKWEMSTDIS